MVCLLGHLDVSIYSAVHVCTRFGMALVRQSKVSHSNVSVHLLSVVVGVLTSGPRAQNMLDSNRIVAMDVPQVDIEI